MGKMTKAEALHELCAAYVDIRNKLKPLEKEKEEINVQIKALIGDKTQVPVDGYRVSYDYDKDKRVVTFNEEKLKEDNPKLYKELLKREYVTVETKPGNRRLIIESLE